ncbi:MAG: fluoride efflux transporter CrcB [Candidatus Binatia bacterium]
MRAAYVALGGCIGSLLRYWLAGAVQQLNGTDFPAGTLTVNALGSFALGLLMSLSLDGELIDADLRHFLGVGLCGGFTTMSAFSYETMALLRDGSSGFALVNIAASLAICLVAVWLGELAGRML